MKKVNDKDQIKYQNERALQITYGQTDIDLLIYQIYKSIINKVVYQLELNVF